ncbi:hypothetical protein SDC9_06375 [bioreactor metagenome]|uniref:Uncharacterized protein n=1 Tax=bioreactor metagenome TaxID=1076179 RepID=A0A644T1M3_9ZZZZ
MQKPRHCRGLRRAKMAAAGRLLAALGGLVHRRGEAHQRELVAGLRAARRMCGDRHIGAALQRRDDLRVLIGRARPGTFAIGEELELRAVVHHHVGGRARGEGIAAHERDLAALARTEGDEQQDIAAPHLGGLAVLGVHRFLGRGDAPAFLGLFFDEDAPVGLGGDAVRGLLRAGDPGNEKRSSQNRSAPQDESLHCYSLQLPDASRPPARAFGPS